MPRPYINQLEEGQSVTSFFVVRRKETREHEGNPYLVLELGDKTGRLQARIWEDVEQARGQVDKGDVAKVKGTVVRYRDTLQIRVDKLRRASPKEYDRRDLLRTSDRDAEEVFGALQRKTEVVKDPQLRALLGLCFSDPGVVERFKTAPGGKRWHHPYLGGLMEHTLAVVELCDAAAAVYPLVDRSLLVAGALLHDIGNIQAFSYDLLIEYTDVGRLEGHIALGAKLVEDLIGRTEGFPEELKFRLLHLVLSHHRELKQGSPVVPMTLEALILAYANETDIKAAGFAHVIESQKEPGQTWSRWVNLMDRFIYFGEGAPPTEEEPDAGASE